jgi:hypothetical protein
MFINVQKELVYVYRMTGLMTTCLCATRTSGGSGGENNDETALPISSSDADDPSRNNKETSANDKSTKETLVV